MGIIGEYDLYANNYKINAFSYFNNFSTSTHLSSGASTDPIYVSNWISNLLGDDLWKSIIFYVPSSFPDNIISVAKKFFPTVEKLPDTLNSSISLVDKDGELTGVVLIISPSDPGGGYSVGYLDTFNYAAIPFPYGVTENGGSYNFQFWIMPEKYINNSGIININRGDYHATGNYLAKDGIQFKIQIWNRGQNVGCDVFSTASVFTSDTIINYFNGKRFNGFSTDPYDPGGTSGGGGGGGSFEVTSTPIGFSGLPSIQLSDTGFLTLYNPSQLQIKNLASYMWSTGFSLDDFKKLFADPMSAIIGLQLVPVTVPQGTTQDVKIGNISTGVFMPLVSSQWVAHSCGSLTIPEFWGAYLDFNPYTQLQIFLPYIGVRSINADEIIGKKLELRYNVDVLSGACVAQLMSGNSVLYTWQGSCGLQIPFTANTYSNLLGSILQVAGAGVAIAGASSVGAVAAAGLSAVSGVANSQKQDISHGGTISGAGGFLDIQTPYIILSRPNLCMPVDQNKFIGYPSFVTVSLSSLSGMTTIEEIHIENVPATANELEEIESLLKSGVIF